MRGIYANIEDLGHVNESPLKHLIKSFLEVNEQSISLCHLLLFSFVYSFRYHHMSNGTINFAVNGGKFDLDVTTFQMAVLFAWNQRPNDKITYENLRLATELPNGELRRTLWSLVAFPKLKRQLLLFSPAAANAKEFNENTVFWVNQDFALIKNGKPQKRGKVSKRKSINFICIQHFWDILGSYTVLIFLLCYHEGDKIIVCN